MHDHNTKVDKESLACMRMCVCVCPVCVSVYGRLREHTLLTTTDTSHRPAHATYSRWIPTQASTRPDPSLMPATAATELPAKSRRSYHRCAHAPASPVPPLRRPCCCSAESIHKPRVAVAALRKPAPPVLPARPARVAVVSPSRNDDPVYVCVV